MQKGFTLTTLGLVGAALLSSSAFAVGPTLKRLPDVYITGNTKNPAQVDIGTHPSGATDIYRFTDAFLLQDYVEFSDLSAVSWDFRELDETMTPVTGGAKTISINGLTGEDALPTYASVTGSGGTVSNEPSLDFINIALTPDLMASGTAPTGGVDQATIEVYVASGTVANEIDVAAFDVYTTNDDNIAAFDLASAPSSIYDSVACIDDFENWFTQSISISQAPTFSPALTTAKLDTISYADPVNTRLPFDAAPATATLTNGTTSAGGGTAASPGSAFQYISWQSLRRDVVEDGTTTRVAGIPVSADTIYMARWTISSDALTTAAGRAASVQLPNVRLRMGETGNKGNGQISHEFPDNGLNGIIGNDQELRTYYYVKGAYNEGFATASPEMGLYFDILDQFAPDTGANGSNTIAGSATPNGQRNYGLTLSQVEVFSFSRDDLSGASVEFNNGSALVTVAAGEVNPSNDSRADFNAATWEFRDNGLTAGNRGSSALSASALTFTLSQTSTTTAIESYFLQADTNPFATANGEEVVTVSNDRLVIIDAYMSTNAAAASGTNALPGRGSGGGIRLGMQTAVYAPAGIPVVEGVIGSFDPNQPFYSTIPVSQGRAGYFEFSASNREVDAEGGEVLGTPYALETAAKRVSYIFEPLAVDVSSGPALSFRPTVEVYAFPSFNRADADAFETFTGTPAEDVTAAYDAGVVTVNRVVITSYDLPGDPDSNCP